MDSMEQLLSIPSLTNCSICLESFRSPVTTGCGHSFCSDCIKKYWDQQSSFFTCPECRQIFSSRPQLAKNICLSQISEVFRQKGTSGHPVPDPDPDPGSNPDRSPRLPCQAHHKKLQFYCCTERVAFCNLCNGGDHKTHHTVMLKEELARAQASLHRLRGEVEEEFAQLLVQVERAGCKVSDFLHRAEGELLNQSESTLRQLDEDRLQLSQEQLELQTLLDHQNHLLLLERSQTLKMTPDSCLCPANQSEVPEHLNKLSTATKALSDLLKHHLDVFIQLNLPSGATTDQYQSVRPMVSAFQPSVIQLSTLTVQKDGQSQPLESQPTTHNFSTPDSTALSPFSQDDERLTLSVPRTLQETPPEPQTRQQLMQYLTEITFDPNTASDSLHLSDSRRRVVNTHPELQNYPAHAERFTRICQVLGEQEFPDGRYYWEMSITGAPVMVGLAYRQINRSSRGAASFLGRNQVSWCLELAEGSGIAWHSNKPSDPVPAPYQCLGLYLSIPGQTLTFYGITDIAVPLHHFQATFTQPLLPAFQINRGSSIQIKH
ncbi:tripartite motif-containing protein 65-like isoform X2 [Carcharodon carcharias]|uniref:tripartite motif-containing protein 65-like isoform X2 n=1 Tax=Carcharodon carcharias TaxID=13397 RepID=UPI001B7EA56D|nr:tripartite motif-containing protein 65-like isoform X2 [Carcharodon carcharias]